MEVDGHHDLPTQRIEKVPDHSALQVPHTGMPRRAKVSASATSAEGLKRTRARLLQQQETWGEAGQNHGRCGGAALEVKGRKPPGGRWRSFNRGNGGNLRVVATRIIVFSWRSGAQVEHPVRRQETHHRPAMVLHTQCGLANGDPFTRAAGAGSSQCSYSNEKVFEMVRGHASNMSFIHFGRACQSLYG